MPRPAGTDGGDHKSRMIIEDRYRLAATTKRRMKICHALLTLYLFVLCMWMTFAPVLGGKLSATANEDPMEDIRKAMWTVSIIFVGVPTVMTTRRVLTNSYKKGITSTLLIFSSALCLCGGMQAASFYLTPPEAQASYGRQIAELLETKGGMQPSAAAAAVHNTQIALAVLGVLLPTAVTYFTRTLLHLQQARTVEKKGN